MITGKEETSAQVEKQVPEFINRLQQAVQEGNKLQQALELAFEDPNLTGTSPEEAEDRARSRRAFKEALRNLLIQVPHEDLNVVLATILARYRGGGSLADTVKSVTQLISLRRLN